MNTKYVDIVNKLKRYHIFEGNLVDSMYELNEKDFLNVILDNISLEPPMDSNSSLVCLDNLSLNVKKEILVWTFSLNKVGSIHHISTFDELFEYSEFYYLNSPESVKNRL